MTKKRPEYLRKQIANRLREIDRIGESRQEAKNQLRTLQGKLRFGETVEGIHSYSTKNNYEQVANQFMKYCVEEKKEKTRADLDMLIRIHSVNYLKMREKKGLSVSTLSRDRAALNKISKNQDKIDYKFRTRSIHDVKRSRNNSNKNNPNFNEKLNESLVSLSKGTGGRREDLSKLTPQSFFEKNGNLYVSFVGSKGGKDRVSIVREEHRESIQNRIDSTQKNELLFERIHKHADIHSYRREYAQELYKDIIQNKNNIKKELIEIYGNRNERSIKSEYYKTKSEDNFFSGKRDDIYLITKSLGHERLDVAVNSYLRWLSKAVYTIYKGCV